jgi:hypothetical protein
MKRIMGIKQTIQMSKLRVLISMMLNLGEVLTSLLWLE